MRITTNYEIIALAAGVLAAGVLELLVGEFRRRGMAFPDEVAILRREVSQDVPWLTSSGYYILAMRDQLTAIWEDERWNPGQDEAMDKLAVDRIATAMACRSGDPKKGV